MCTQDSLSWPWAVDYRVKDLKALTSESMREFLKGEGFSVVGMREFLAMS
jgi:hypothetical protein